MPAVSIQTTPGLLCPLSIQLTSCYARSFYTLNMVCYAHFLYNKLPLLSPQFLYTTPGLLCPLSIQLTSCYARIFYTLNMVCYAHFLYNELPVMPAFSTHSTWSVMPTFYTINFLLCPHFLHTQHGLLCPLSIQ